MKQGNRQPLLERQKGPLCRPPAVADLGTRNAGTEGRTALLSSDEVLAVGGGVPIVVDSRVVGALGVSGGTSAQDTEIAAAVISLP